MEKNKDTVPDEHLALLGSTSSPFLKSVLDARAAADAALPQPSTRKVSGPGIASKKPTLGTQFKASLGALMDTINSTEVHYIRCIKPNDAKVAWEVQPQNVLSQLRACGVLETIRISCAGFPGRWTFADFVERYYMLVPSSHLSLIHI